MKFTEEKKQAVLRYILEKISQHDPRVTKTVSETMNINQNTVHSYITELIEQGVIRRVKRGQYELVRKQYKFCLERSKGDLDSDLYAYQKYLAPIIQDEPKCAGHLGLCLHRNDQQCHGSFARFGGAYPGRP